MCCKYFNTVRDEYQYSIIDNIASDGDAHFDIRLFCIKSEIQNIVNNNISKSRAMKLNIRVIVIFTKFTRAHI